MLTDSKNKNLKLEDALQDFLIQYRITSPCTTGVTPSERMFSRQIHIYYTTYVPDKIKIQKRVNTNLNKRFHEFAVGESVQCRNYNGTVKWKHGKITHRLGKLHYRMTLDDGRTWERHVDQILQSGEY